LPEPGTSAGSTYFVPLAQMFAGAGVIGADGSEWYVPQRLSIDLAAVGNGTASGAQRALGRLW
jgi:hypothetical protein